MAGCSARRPCGRRRGAMFVPRANGSAAGRWNTSRHAHSSQIVSTPPGGQRAQHRGGRSGGGAPLPPRPRAGQPVGDHERAAAGAVQASVVTLAGTARTARAGQGAALDCVYAL